MLDRNELKSVIDSVNYNISGVETLLAQKECVVDRKRSVLDELEEIKNRQEFLEETKGFYVKAVDIMYEESIGALKETLNAALQYIVTDKNYTCNLTLEDKRGAKYLYVSAIDNEQGFEVDLKHSMGQGVRAIISFVLKAFYLINQNSRILFLDEKYSTISEHYVPRFFEFVKKFAEEKGFILVMITHDVRFMDYADRCYTVKDGHVELTDNIHGILETT